MTSVTMVPTGELLHQSKWGRIRCHQAARYRTGMCAAAVAGALVTLAALPARAGWVGDAMDLMGTRVSVELWADDEARGRELVVEVMNEYRRIDAGMSTYKPDSEISRVNAHAAEG